MRTKSIDKVQFCVYNNVIRYENAYLKNEK